MGGENTIYPYLAAMDVLPAQLSCSCEASSWSFSVLPGQHVARAASRGLLHTLPCQCPVTKVLPSISRLIGDKLVSNQFGELCN